MWKVIEDVPKVASNKNTKGMILMKLNNKGFMMAEVVVVSAIILIFMTSMYATYNKIFSAYKQRISYYDVTTLYKLGYYKNAMVDNKEVENWKQVIRTNEDKEATYKYGSVNEGDTVYLIFNNKDNLSERVVNKISKDNPNKTYIDYIKYLTGAAELKTYEYVMTLESCQRDENTNTYIKDCKYAYLEITEEGGTDG